VSAQSTPLRSKAVIFAPRYAVGGRSGSRQASRLERERGIWSVMYYWPDHGSRLTPGPRPFWVTAKVPPKALRVTVFFTDPMAFNKVSYIATSSDQTNEIAPPKFCIKKALVPRPPRRMEAQTCPPIDQPEFLKTDRKENTIRRVRFMQGEP